MPPLRSKKRVIHRTNTHLENVCIRVCLCVCLKVHALSSIRDAESCVGNVLGVDRNHGRVAWVLLAQSRNNEELYEQYTVSLGKIQKRKLFNVHRRDRVVDPLITGDAR